MSTMFLTYAKRVIDICQQPCWHMPATIRNQLLEPMNRRTVTILSICSTYLSNTSYPADAGIDNLRTFLFLFLQIIALLQQKYPFCCNMTR